MSRDALLAYRSWQNQRQRCYYKKDRRYEFYGGKNIQVEYSSREFIGWWMSKIKYFKGKTPSVGRIDHEENYCFGNIELVDLSDNVRERNKRHGNPSPPKIITVFFNGKPIDECRGTRAAEKKGYSLRGSIKFSLKTGKTSKKGYRFIYKEMTNGAPKTQ